MTTNRIVLAIGGIVLALLIARLAGCGAEQEQAPPPTTVPRAAQTAPEEVASPSAEDEAAARRAAEEQARLEEQRRRPASYVVQAGDHLWGISGREAIYDGSHYWPLLYDANAERIRDPDLIYPGQELQVPRFDSEQDRQHRLFELWHELGAGSASE